MIVGDAPRDIAVEHNTVDSNGNTVLCVYGGSGSDPRKIYGFRFSSNAPQHRTYGINGQFFGSGNTAIAGFFPDGVFETNYLAGGSLTRLPACTLVRDDFEHQFVDTAKGDYTVRNGMSLDRAASDGSDIGVQFAALMEGVDGVKEGRLRAASPPPRPRPRWRSPAHTWPAILPTRPLPAVVR